MLFKQLEDKSWLKAEIEVYLPDGRIVNQENQIEGWVYHNEEPAEYTAWVESQNQELQNNIP